MDGIRRTPYQYPLLGSVNELVGGLLGYMRDPRRTQQMQGLAGLLESTGIPKTVERLAYGEPLTNIQRANVPLLRPETAEALLTVAPVPPIAGRATMAAGRAGERLAERVVPQIMERGGMPAGLLEGMSSRTVSPLTVYHGSPHKFDKFDASKIGTGEGGSMYGVGTNLTESPSLAQNYRELTSGYEAFTTVDGLKDTSDIASMIARSYSGDAEKAVKSLERKIPNLEKKLKSASKEELMLGLSDYDMADMELQAQLRKVEEAKSYIGKDVKLEKPGYLYKVDLPDEIIAKMVDRDKPFSEQPKNVQDYFSKILKVDFENETGWAKLKGDRLIEAVRDRLNLGKGDFETALSEAGIPGSKYINESSGAGQGAQNFVVFPTNENLLTIKQINDKLVGGLLGQSKAVPAFDVSKRDASDIFGAAPKVVERGPAESLLDYRGSHTAPGPDFGAPLHDLTGGGQMYPADVYSPKATQYYGTGYPKADKEAFDLAKRVKGNPDAEVTMYRAVPNNKEITEINAGDWVTLSQDYAKTHGESALQGDYKILKKKVRAKDLWTNADSIHEFGYHPSE